MSNFTSFVDYDSEKKPSIAVSNHLAPSPIPAQSKNLKIIDFLPNEFESCSCENVSFSMQFGESEQGRVVCTKVRLRFLPAVKRERDLPQRSKFFDDFYDVPLTAIAKIEVAVVKSEDLIEEVDEEKEPERLSEKVVEIGWRMYENWMSWGTGKGKHDKFHRMEYNMSSMETVSMIRLILKDMRVVTVDLRRSQNGTALANQILFFSKTGTIDKMVQCGAAMEDRGQKAKIPYNGYDAWHSELQRCNQKTDSSSAWTILALHKEGFNYVAQGYPMYVVVSNYLTRTDIERQLQNFKQGRFPIWVWSRASGNAALMICADHENNVATPEIIAKIQDSISRGPPENNKPHFLKLESDFVTSVGKAFDNLISLCAIDSYEQYVSREHTWHQKMHRIGWTQLVRSTLATTFEAIQWIVDRNRTLILQEEDGVDASIVVGSLVQICCDPFYRTTTGFQQLIDKMWIAMGHPFGERLVGRDDDVAKHAKNPTKQSSEKTDVAPTWLLFLDCVAQLHKIYQFEFTFSQHVLIALWDLSLTGMVPAMACNNLEEQLVSRVGGGPFPLDRYYTKDYSRMFGNIWHDSVLFLESLKSNSPFSAATSQFLQCETIRPPTSLGEITLWNECFLRWLLPANGKMMGAPSEELALDEKMMEIGKRMRSNEWKRHLDLPEEFSSAYPYSIPEISRPIIDFNESLGSDRPDTLDNVSIHSSLFNSFSFVQTPTLNSTFDSDTGTISSMRPAEQAVSFRKSSPREDQPAGAMRNHSATVATSSQEAPVSEPPSTPVRRAHTVRVDNRPVPPPRPAILRIRMDPPPEESAPQVTRF